jgi:hypothetical protein
MAKTDTRNMQMRNIPGDTSIGKPEPRVRGESGMAAEVTLVRKEQVPVGSNGGGV